MVFACGLSFYEVSFFHLINHAFFKSLLFLGAGSVIHSLAGEQDIRKMGGLLRVLPFTYTCFLIGSLSLCGFPFLTGVLFKRFNFGNELCKIYCTKSVCFLVMVLFLLF
jgi:NADH-ubiquinone oxidoreductase chain 5